VVCGNPGCGGIDCGTTSSTSIKKCYPWTNENCWDNPFISKNHCIGTCGQVNCDCYYPECWN
jgi:hypothetical protein